MVITKARLPAAVNVKMSSGTTVMLSKEQAAILLPLLPTLAENMNSTKALQAKVQSTASSSGPKGDDAGTVYTNAEMFSRKLKSSRSTAVENHLLVSM